MKWHVVNSLFMQVPRRAQSKAANAFDELRAAQQQLAGLAQPPYDSKGEMVLHYPEYKILSVHNNKDQLHVDLFETFQRNGLGWMSSEHASNLGTPFLNALAKLLWEITDHLGNFGKQTVPARPMVGSIRRSQEADTQRCQTIRQSCHRAITERSGG